MAVLRLHDARYVASPVLALANAFAIVVHDVERKVGHG
jgi:hypothetical protein